MRARFQKFPPSPNPSQFRGKRRISKHAHASFPGLSPFDVERARRRVERLDLTVPGRAGEENSVRYLSFLFKIPLSELILQLFEINFTGSKALRMDVVKALYCANNGAADVVGRGWLSKESLRKLVIHTRLFEELKARILRSMITWPVIKTEPPKQERSVDL